MTQGVHITTKLSSAWFQERGGATGGEVEVEGEGWGNLCSIT